MIERHKFTLSMEEKRGSNLIVANLKMNPVTIRERDRYLRLFKDEYRKKTATHTDIVICPPFVFLETMGRQLPKNIFLGAQDCFWERSGAYTGEISAAMLREVGCQYVIVGHSERRLIDGETDEMVAQKLEVALQAGLTSILCVGETQQEHSQNLIAEVLARQLSLDLQNISSSQLKELVIAYEPVWSVGSDQTPSSREIMQARLMIRREIARKYGLGMENRVRVIYGGSVHRRNVDQVCAQADMDGVLIGRESLDPKELLAILSEIEK